MKEIQLDTRIPLTRSVQLVLEGWVSRLDLDRAIERDPHEAIHETRKTIKRIRALLRMVRDETGYSYYLRENRRFRDLSRGISRARDLRVLSESLEAMEQGRSARFDPQLLAGLKSSVNERLDAELQVLVSPEGPLDNLPTAFGNAVGQLQGSLSLRDSFQSVRKGIRRTYRRARRLMGRMEEAPGMALSHEFRKNCRYLQFQMELLRGLYPELLKGYAASIDRLTETLGRIRDRQRLEIFIREEGKNQGSIKDEDSLLDAVRSDYRRATRKVRSCAPLVFAEKPGRFAGRLQRYWEIHRNPKPLSTI